MSFAMQVLASAREQLLQSIIESQTKINELDEFMAGRAEPETTVQMTTPPAEDAAKVAEVIEKERAAVEGPQQTKAGPAQGDVSTGETFDETRQAGDDDISPLHVPDTEEDNPNAPEPPWSAPAPAKAGGRRTNDEIAAENGVTVAQVRTWKPTGRLSMSDIEEYARLVREGEAFGEPVEGQESPKEAPTTATVAPSATIAVDEAPEEAEWAAPELVEGDQGDKDPWDVRDEGFGSEVNTAPVEETEVETDWKPPF